MSQVTSTAIQKAAATGVTFPDPVLTITADTSAAGTPLKAGKYTFSVVVTDTDTKQSATASCVVEVRNAPTVTLTGPPVVALNQNIQLTAAPGPSQTFPPNVSYVWTVK